MRSCLDLRIWRNHLDADGVIAVRGRGPGHLPQRGVRQFQEPLQGQFSPPLLADITGGPAQLSLIRECPHACR